MAAKMQRTRHPGIYKRGSRYVVVWRHRGTQVKKACRTLADALEEQGKRRQTGERRPYSRAWFEEYATEWLDSYQGRTARGLTDTSREAYRAAITKHALPFFERYRLADIEPPDVRAFVQHMESKGMKPASVRKYVTPLKALFATAVDDGAIRWNPASNVRINGADTQVDGKAKAMTREELGIMLAAVPDEWRLFFTFLAHTGLRISEALGVTWDHLELGMQPRLRVREQVYKGTRKKLKSKNSRRDIPLSPGMVSMLLEHRAKTYRADRQPVFASRVGTPLGDNNLRRRVLRPTAESVGLAWVDFHTFRHTCASLLFEEGRTIKQVSVWLGHADPAFTLRTYVHLLDEGIGDAAFLDDALHKRSPVEQEA
jgi:integrase